MNRIKTENIDRLYERVVADFSDLPQGFRLPSYTKFPARFNCTRKEMELVMRRLEENGLISVFRRKGSFWNGRKFHQKCRILVVRPDWPSLYWDFLEEKLAVTFGNEQDILLSFKRVPVPITAKDYLTLFSPEQCDIGITVCSFHCFSRQETSALLGGDVPLIFIDSHIICESVGSVDAMPGYTGMQAAAYLLAKGHRKILTLLSVKDDLLYQREMDGFLNYLTICGIEPLVLRWDFEYGSSPLWELEPLLLDYLQKNEQNFTAFYASGYQEAACMYEIAKNCGLSVPENLSILVGSDMPVLSERQPKLTAVSRDFDGYMKAIVKIVKKLRAGEHVGCIRVPSYVIERGSVRDISDTAEPLQIDVSSFLQDGIGRMFCFQNLLEEKKYDSKL